MSTTARRASSSPARSWTTPCRAPTTFPTFSNALDDSVPAKTNPLGAKGVGELGAVGSTPTVMNAIMDALWPLGVRNVQMPATPLRVWQAIQDTSN